MTIIFNQGVPVVIVDAPIYKSFVGRAGYGMRLQSGGWAVDSSNGRLPMQSVDSNMGISHLFFPDEAVELC